MEYLIPAWIVSWLICGFLSADLARKKGYSYGSWFACGLFFGVLGLVAAAGLPVNQDDEELDYPEKKCPTCAEDIRAEAYACRFCGQTFSQAEVSQALEECN